MKSLSFREAMRKDATANSVHVVTALGNQKEKANSFKQKLRSKDSTTVPAAMKRLPVEIAKVDPEQQMIFGWASVATLNGEAVIDKQGDIIPIDELEKAAYDFLLNGGVMGHMHERTGVGRPIESMVFTKAKCDALGIKMDREGWFVGFRVDDPEVWKLHKAGALPEFSIGGSGLREPA